MTTGKISKKSAKDKRWGKIIIISQNFLLLLFGIILAFIISEIVLKIYNPFEFRVKGDKIILPINKKYIIKNNSSVKLDNSIIHTKNSLGFRGDEPPEYLNKYLTIITIGGSTTECFYLTDGKTWTDMLGDKLRNVFKDIWINNAGLDGQSTFGHILLMEDHVIKLKPKIILFLVGVNDKGLNGTFNKYDQQILRQGINFQSFKSFMISMTNESEVFSLLLNIYRYMKTRNMKLLHEEIDLRGLESIDIPEDTKNRFRQNIKNTNYKSFENRLRKLIHISKENGIEPVFVTQPALYGNAVDDLTNVNLTKIKVWGNSGELEWESLEYVNSFVRKVGKEENILVIDLANKLQKSSKYFYDFLHFTNEGSEKVAEIISVELCPLLAKKYNRYLTADCNDLSNN
jgi:hypothetical protein